MNNTVVKTKEGIVGVVITLLGERVIVQEENGRKHWAYEDELKPSTEPLYVVLKDVEIECECCGGSGKDTEQQTIVKRK